MSDDSTVVTESDVGDLEWMAEKNTGDDVDVDSVVALPKKNNENTKLMTSPKTTQEQEDEQPAAALPSGWTQVAALMHKNAVTKARTPFTTAAEIFSPMVLLLVLVYAYSWSEVFSVPHGYYHALQVHLPLLVEHQRLETPDAARDFDPADLTRRRRDLAQGKLVDFHDKQLLWDEDDRNDDTPMPMGHWVRRMFQLAAEHGPEDELAVLQDWMHDVYQEQHRNLFSVQVTDEDLRAHEQQQMVQEEDVVLDLDQEEEEQEQMSTNNQQEAEGQAQEENKERTPLFLSDVDVLGGDGNVTTTLYELLEEMVGDVKEETLQEIDWDNLQHDMADNLRDMWDDVSDYVFWGDFKSYRSRYNMMNQVRTMLKQLLSGPMVVPNFGQYVGASSLLRSFFNVRWSMPRVFEDSSYGRQWGNLLTLGTLHVTPTGHPLVEDFQKYLQWKYPVAMRMVTIQEHASQDDALAYVMDTLDDERTWAILDLEQLETDAQDKAAGGTFQIRMNYTTLPNTAILENYVATGLSTRYQRYYLSGYLTLQRTINDFVLWHAGCGDRVSEEHVDPFFSMPMPTAAYDQNIFFLQVGYLLGLILVMAYLYPTSRLIQGLVEEREIRMKETLLILGVKPWAHTMSWILSSMAMFGVIAFLIVSMLSQVVTHTPFMVLFVWMFLFSMAAMSFCMFVATWFSRAKLAAVVGPMALFASVLPRFIFFGTNRYEAIGAKYLASLLPGAALALGADIVGDYEYGEQNVADNFWSGDYSFGSCCSMLAFDCILYMVLSWYAEQVIPRPFGAAAKPWYFPFLMCCPVLRKESGDAKHSILVNDEKIVEEIAVDDWNGCDAFKKDKRNTDGEDVDDCIEPVTDPALVPRVHIKNLVKKYNKKSKPAVNNLDLTLYESHITALLGHNGAGKTSTVSVLTGLYAPTSGDVSIYGHSIIDELVQARQSIGICPQHNVLFDNLTVMEHLKFFSKIKGISADPKDLEAKALEMGLTEDQFRTTASALSGGNKRKLSVAVALCGNPKFLILDEPTSAMDPSSRRHCWSVLRKKRAGRVTLLTTHFMDEAEHLSDRVAVMKEGSLQCCGTPLYLKDRFNLGWNVTIVMNKQDAADAGEMQEARQESIASFLRQFIPEAQLARKAGRELTFYLPKGSEDLFADAFDTLEQQSKDLGVASYGIASSSFEEVFLLLAEKETGSASVPSGKDLNEVDTESFAPTDIGSLSKASESEDSISDSESVGTSNPNETPFMLTNMESDKKKNAFKETEHLQPMSVIRQIGLLYWKRFAVQKRDLKGAFFTVILPVVLVALVVLVLTVEISIAGPPLETSVAMFDNSYSASSASRSAGPATEVLIGGGEATSASMKSSFLAMEPFMTRDYPTSQMTYLSEAATSEDVSRYLLSTYNDHDHPVRYGAFALEDNVLLNVTLNFSAFRDQIQEIENELVRDNVPLRNKKVNLLQLLGLTNGYRGISFEIRVIDLFNDFIQWTDVHPYRRVAVSTSYMQHFTQTALENIMRASNKNLTDTRLGYEAEVRNFTREIFSFVTDFMKAPKVQEIKGNATEIVLEFLDGLKKTTQNRDQIEKDLNGMLSAFFSEILVEKKDADGNDILEIQGSMRERVQVFLDSLRDVGQSEDGTTQSLYDLVVEFSHKMIDFANATVLDISDNAYDVETLQGAILQVLEDGEDDGFDRAVIAEEFASILEEIAFLFGREVTALSNVNYVMDWLDEKTRELLGDENAKIPASFYVAPLVMMDAALQTWNYTTEMSVYDVFAHASEWLGGVNKYALDGYVGFYARALNIDFGAMAVEFDNISIRTRRGTLFSLDDSYSFKTTFESLASMIPNSTSVQVHFDVYSKTSLLHNSSSPHAVAVFNQAYMENLYHQCKGDAGGNARLTSINHPLPLTTRQSLEIKVMLSVLAGLFILIPYCYIPASFIVFIVRERVSKSKHLQLVSGVNMSAYWIANYLWDISLYFLLTVCIMVVFFFYGEKADVFVGDFESFLATFLLTFGYGLSALPFAYALSRGFDNSSTAQISVAGIGWLTGFVTVIAYVTMDSTEKTYEIAQALLPFFRLFPAYHVGEGFISISEAFWKREIGGSQSSPLDWDVAGLSISYIFLLAIPYFLIVLILEYSDDGGAGGPLGRFIRGLTSLYTKAALRWHGIRTDSGEGDAAQYTCLGTGENRTPEDSDVADERAYVQKSKNELKKSASVVLVNLWKIYPPSVGLVGSVMFSLRRLFSSIFCCCFRKSEIIDEDSDGEAKKTYAPKQAVRGVTTAINRGETYALLGSNGAGKSTTMGMLTGDITSTNGHAYIAGHDTTNNGVAEARKNIGFCPQKDPLLDLMTGRETLQLFARLRGVQKDKISSLVDRLLEQLTLTPHADKVTKAYSGGNKRKLSLGLALIGDPEVLLIDEASSGLDPLARRRMWELIEEAGRSRSVVLTTHDLHEAESLATRVAIMVKGKFVCLGSVQHLKNKYLDGYSVDVYCESTASEFTIDTIVGEFESALPGCSLVERHGRFLRLEVASVSALGLGTCFRRLQDLKSSLPVENYSISQSSLEQVFVKLVSNSDDAEEPEHAQDEDKISTSL